MAIVVVVAVCVVMAKRAAGQLPDHVVASWDFEDDLDGWAQSSWEEMGAQIYAEGGEMRGRVQRAGSVPRFDSPMFRIDVEDKQTVLMRIKYSGQVLRGARVDVRLLGNDSSLEDFQSLPLPFGGGGATIQSVPFDTEVFPDGRYAIIKAPVHEYVSGTIVQLRIFPVQVAAEDAEVEAWSTFDIDWVRIVVAPTITKVEGCLNKYFEEEPLPLDSSRLARRADDGEYVFRGGHEAGENSFVTEIIASNDDGHLLEKNLFASENETSPFATTFNCPRSGPETRIRITGRNFGDYAAVSSRVLDALDETAAASATGPDGALRLWETVKIDGELCADIVMLEEERVLECTLPATSKTSGVDRVSVFVQQPDFRLLQDTKPYFSYAVPAPRPLAAPEVSNLGAHALDLSWDPPVNPWDAATVTGYKVLIYTEAIDPLYKENIPGQLASNRTDRYILVREEVLGNVTSTSVVDLSSGRNYRFALKALVEDPRAEACWAVDLYGRRHLVAGALESVASPLTAIETTLDEDVEFLRFPAASTLSRGAADARSISGPSRNEGGEGHYGLRLVGNAQIENCNETSACCDYAADGSCETICVSTATQVGVNPDYVNMTASRQVPGNGPQNEAEFFIGPPVDWDGGEDLSVTGLPACGPALRLTPSRARASGAAWYPRKLNVREGFVTEFTLRLSNPSLVCTIMDDEATSCRSRGADGLAFVVQNANADAMGSGGMDLGFSSIPNALAVEFDTFHNPERRDPYENHIAVFAMGDGAAMESGHHAELASTAAIPDLTQGSHRVRIEYAPRMLEDDVLDPAFATTSHTADLMAAHDAWSFAVGTLKVFLDDLHRPVLVTLLNVDAIMALDSGRAWVGFTAATGDGFWQAHEVLAWTFRSLRDEPTASTIV